MNIKFDLPKIDIGLTDFDLDLSAFSMPNCENKNRYILPKPSKHATARSVKYNRAEELIVDVGSNILNGERVDVLLSGNFIFGDVFEAIATRCAVEIQDLTLSTLSFGQENVDSFANMMTTGYLHSLNIVVSDYFWSHNRVNAAYIYENLDIEDRFQLAVAETHTKIALALIDGKKIVIHGSANLRSSRSVETATFETNPDLYDFHKAWHDDILRNYATIQKPMRAQKLFDHLTKGKS